MSGLRCLYNYKRNRVASLLTIAVVSALCLTLFHRQSNFAVKSRCAGGRIRTNRTSNNDLRSGISVLQGELKAQSVDVEEEFPLLDTKNLLRDVEDELISEGWFAPKGHIMEYIANIEIHNPSSLKQIDEDYLLDEREEIIAVAERWKVLHVGCFNESDTTPTLDNEKSPVRVESAKQCIRVCSQETTYATKYASISNGTLCRCGTRISLEATKSDFDPRKCNYRCPRGFLQPCSAAKFMRVYRIAKHSLDYLSTENIRRSIAGCFIRPEDWNNVFELQVIRQNPSSVQCLLACERANFVIAGWDSSGECRCGKFTPQYTLERLGQRVNDNLCELATGDYVSIMRTLSVDARCENRKFFKEKRGRLIALASYPGSGNTWTRHLIESATGIYTGSVYNDKDLYKEGFLGGALPWNSSRTSVIKTHDTYGKEPNKFEEAVIVIRNPYDAIMAEFNRVRAGHMGHAEPELFYEPVWRYFTAQGATRWYNVIEKYTRRKRVLIIFYEDMVKNPIREIRKIVKFLNYPILDLDQRLACVESNMIGEFKRPKKKLPFDPYTQKLKNIVNICIQSARKLLSSRSFPPLPVYER